MSNKWLYTFVGVGSILVSTNLYAACKMAYPANAGTFTVNTTVEVGEAVVSASDPIGKVLKTTSTSFSQMSKANMVTCTGSSTLSGYFKKSFPLSSSGNRIFLTNVSGVGIRISMQSDNNPVQIPGSAPTKGAKVYGKGNIIVELIKISHNLDNGALETGLWGEYFYTGIAQAKQRIYISGRVKVNQPTCSWKGNPNRTINLKSVSRSDFRGVGSTLAEQAFNIDLNCGAGAAGKVGLGFDFNAHLNNNSVIQNDANNSIKAQGVNLQLVSNYKDSMTVISKGMKLALGNVQSNQAQNFTVPMRARYFQSDSRVTSGEVNGSATVTIRYD